MTRPDRITGAPCPSCACQRSELIRPPYQWMGRTFEQRRCGNCKKRFSAVQCAVTLAPAPLVAATASDDSVAEYVDIRCRCPRCRAVNPKVERTVRTGTTVTRHHRCDQCGHPFKSVSENVEA